MHETEVRNPVATESRVGIGAKFLGRVGGEFLVLHRNAIPITGHDVMALRLEVVSDVETTQTLERRRPSECGRPVLGTALVLVAAAASVGMWFSFRFVEGALGAILVYWAKF